MASTVLPTTLDVLSQFKVERIISEDPLNILGTFPDPTGDSRSGIPAIVRMARTAIDTKDVQPLFGDDGLIKKIQVEENNDIYTWLFGWFREDRQRDVRVDIICPATETHIRKYSHQEQKLIRETPELYERILKPYILALPAARTQWVENILLGITEAESVLYKSPDFLILPDMKWDRTTLSSLYLQVLVQDRSIRSLRDLRKRHVGLLNDIRREANEVVKKNWPGITALRMLIHYQPSYYHFHVHIVNANYPGTFSTAVGHAHLLDDVISLLELDPDEGPGIFERLTLTYFLGDEHPLSRSMKEAQKPLA
ncbi:scavenger mRNA decapping enzyme [Pluteus cervinus]|uniref:Scavenger mRNA decapping enzyme n=1 Tax=Pluteus cervinus TaxID=181527 RepID=A0ACD3B8N9_9AGAR|nr:scavenger mRNA decapping enzyme [Pluteus cervinus]